MNRQTTIEAAPPAVYGAIAAVQGELAKTGIAKNRTNTQGQGYQFRGIDDVYAALSPLLAKHGLVVVPRVLERTEVERQSKSGGALFYVTVRAEFDFVAVADGSSHTAATYGEAMDSGDKATNKAMSAAYKYAAFMAFAIPTEGDNDADATTYEVARQKVPGISKIKERLNILMRAGNLVDNLEAFNELVHTYKDELQAIKDASHEYWTGDGEDSEGFKAWIKRRRAELTPVEMGETGQMCIDTLNECTSSQELAAWFKLNWKYVEEMDGAERDRVEARYLEIEEGFKAMDMAEG